MSAKYIVLSFTEMQYHVVPGIKGVSDSAITTEVRSMMQCAVLCSIDVYCWAFNLMVTGDKTTCELMPDIFDSTNNDVTSITHYSLQ